jgi:protein TonB
MSRREATAWAAAVVVSVGLHAALFLTGGARLGAPEAPAQESYRATRVTFTSEAPAEAAVPAPASAEPRPEPPKPEQPRPKPEPKKVRPKPVPKAVSEPAQEAQEEPVTPAEPSPNESAVEASPSPPPSAAKGAASPNEAQLTEKEKEAYLAKLLAHIERHKRYPRVARRRGLEGRVAVSFLLTGGGQVENLRTEGGYALLGRAAEAAIHESLPLPAPPEGMELPLSIDFGMVFSLR